MNSRRVPRSRPWPGVRPLGIIPMTLVRDLTHRGAIMCNFNQECVAQKKGEFWRQCGRQLQGNLAFDVEGPYWARNSHEFKNTVKLICESCADEWDPEDPHDVWGYAHAIENLPTERLTTR